MKRHECTDRVTYNLKQIENTTWRRDTDQLAEQVVFRDEIVQELLRAGFWDDGQFGDIPGVERSPKRERKDREAPSKLRGSDTKIRQGGGLWVQKAKNNIRQNTPGHSWPHPGMLNGRCWKNWWWHFRAVSLSKKSGKKWEMNIFCCKAKTRTQTDVKEEMVNEFPKDAGGAD